MGRTRSGPGCRDLPTENAEAPFHEGDLPHFELRRRYDIVSCLFSSIAYVRNRAELDEAVGCIARHLRPHPVSLFEDGDYIAAFEKAKLPAAHDPEGLEGRSLFVAVRPT